MTERARVTPILALVAVLLAIATTLTIVRDRWYPDPNANVPMMLDIRSREAVKRIALSYGALAADLYWIRAVQHFGGEHQAGGAHEYALLYPLLDLTTTLDPRFNVAYRFGAIFLAEPFPGGAGRPDLAIALLKKGIAEQPHRWEYFQDIGFIYYWQVHDYSEAARWYELGSGVPGAPWWLRTLAAVTLARGGERPASRFMWQQILQGADNDWLRQQAQLRLTQLDAMDQIDELQEAVNVYHRRKGSWPASWQTLVRDGLVRGTPLDPTGRPYLLDAGTGTVSLSPDSTLLPLPGEPPGRPAASS